MRVFEDVEMGGNRVFIRLMESPKMYECRFILLSDEVNTNTQMSLIRCYLCEDQKTFYWNLTNIGDKDQNLTLRGFDDLTKQCNSQITQKIDSYEDFRLEVRKIIKNIFDIWDCEDKGVKND